MGDRELYSVLKNKDPLSNNAATKSKRKNK